MSFALLQNKLKIKKKNIHEFCVITKLVKNLKKIFTNFALLQNKLKKKIKNQEKNIHEFRVITKLVKK